MKNSQRCPKCDSQDIIRITGIAELNRNNHPIWSGFFRTAEVTRYLCGQCGYTEEWIDSPKDIDRLRRKYSAAE